MKTIEERAEEYAKSVINSTDDQLMTNDEIMRCAEHDFTIGAEFGYQLCNAEWKEKTRWIPVEERLPEDVLKVKEIDEHHFRTEDVLVRFHNDYPDAPIRITVMPRAKYYYNGEVKWMWICPKDVIVIEWKEII